MKKIISTFMLTGILLSLMSCSPTRPQHLVGNDRDDHGCIASAGYQWSDARKDCIRLWEVGQRYESGEQSLYVVYSPDFKYAELFLSKGEKVLCKKEKDKDNWTAKGKKAKVTKVNGIIQVEWNGTIYTQSEKE